MRGRGGEMRIVRNLKWWRGLGRLARRIVPIQGRARAKIPLLD
jgi:hypothetical protein